MRESEAERAARYEALETSYPTISEGQYRRQSRRSLLTGGAAAFTGFLGWRWLQGQPEDANIPSTLRDVHELNEDLWRGLFRDGQAAPTFDRSKSSMLRVNGRRGGIDNEIDLDSWMMAILDREGNEIGSHDLTAVEMLPMREMTVEHKCIEGWSHIVTWGGVRFSDFVAMYYPAMLDDPPGFVSLETPNGGYYVGLEWAAMMHSQTLLCTELQGEALSQDHGAPLRLVTPLKYGIKQLKRIGTIQFTDEQPDDYWAERGYDYYAGL